MENNVLENQNEILMRSELNEENEMVRESVDTDVKLNDYANIFTKQSDVIKLTQDGQKLSEAIVNQLSMVTSAAVKTDITEALEKEIYDRFKSLNKSYKECSNSDLDMIFAGVEFVEGIENKLNKPNDEELTFHDFLREYLNLFVTTEESIQMTNDAMSKIDQANKEYMYKVEELLSSLDNYEYMNGLLAKADAETDPVKKDALLKEWNSYYVASDMDIILDKLNNKPMKILLKEIHKGFDVAQKKAYNTLKNDSHANFMDIRALQIVLIKIFGSEKEQAIKVLLYLMYKKINKRNRIEDSRLIMFINLFTLNIYKNIKYSQEERNNSVFYKKLEVSLDKINELILSK